MAVRQRLQQEQDGGGRGNRDPERGEDPEDHQAHVVSGLEQTPGPLLAPEPRLLRVPLRDLDLAEVAAPAVARKQEREPARTTAEQAPKDAQRPLVALAREQQVQALQDLRRPDPQEREREQPQGYPDEARRVPGSRGMATNGIGAGQDLVHALSLPRSCRGIGRPRGEGEDVDPRSGRGLGGLDLGADLLLALLGERVAPKERNREEPEPRRDDRVQAGQQEL